MRPLPLALSIALCSLVAAPGLAKSPKKTATKKAPPPAAAPVDNPTPDPAREVAPADPSKTPSPRTVVPLPPSAAVDPQPVRTAVTDDGDIPGAPVAPVPLAPRVVETAAPVETAAEKPTSPHHLAVRARWLIAPGWTLSPYLQKYQPLLDGWSVGMEYIYRNPTFDVVVSADYSAVQPPDGQWQGAGSGDAINYVHFENLSALSLDVSLIGRWNLTSFMEIRVGAGLGVGVLFGDIYRIPSATATTCGADNSGCRAVDTYPMNARVVPVLNSLIGLRFKLHRNIFLRAEGGWRMVSFYAGIAPEFHF